MAALEKFLATGLPIELTTEEAAQEKAAVKTVQREMEEADEANLLEEEDMHVFDREPLTDRLDLVSCNMCKKPIKASQFAAHAERCRSLTASDDTAVELDGGAGHKKPPRKARKKLLPVQDNHTAAGETERLQSLEDDDLCLPESACTSGGICEDQAPIYGTPRGTKKVMNISEGTVVTAPKVGRPRKVPLSVPGEDGAGLGPGSTSLADTKSPPRKRPKLLTTEELDVLCGVVTGQSGACCRRSLTCKLHTEANKRAVTGRRKPFEVLLQEFKANNNRTQYGGKLHDTAEVNPLPMATKVYCLRHHQRMRAVLGSLFRDASTRAIPNAGTSPDDTLSEPGGQLPSALALSSDQSSDLQTKVQPLGSSQKKLGKQRDKKLLPVQASQLTHVKSEPGPLQPLDHARPGTTTGQGGAPGLQHLDSKFGTGGISLENGQSVAGKGRLSQGSPALGTSVPGVSGNATQQSLGGVSVI